uniref:DUF7083 domain-containing protein n=1 Tax=Caenorhabditis japonica TaxID=281687 RepID=A0A8R1EUR3_CAEJA
MNSNSTSSKSSRNKFCKRLAALTTQTTDASRIINSLKNRIPTFTYAPEDGETFDKWFGRHEDTIKLDGADLNDTDKVRFILT